MTTLIGRLVRAMRTRWRVRWALATAKEDSARRLLSAPVRRILVVCYGNIYRSAFVGELLKRELPSSFQVRSSGFHKVVGRASPPAHIGMSRGFGVELGAHLSALTTPEDLAWADLIVLMDRHNWAALDAMGAAPEKLFWLGSLLPGQVEITDPYGKEEALARSIVQRLHDAALALAAQLRESR